MRIFFLAILFVVSLSASADEVDNDLWTDLLQKHVLLSDSGKSTEVDYQGFFNERVQLKKYLQQLSSVEKTTFNNWDKNTRLAFLINTYNAFTVDYILTQWPDIESIKDLGGFFSSPWSKKMIPIFGGLYSLDDIEHDFIRGSDEFADPRIHFAINCASVGCPALRPEAYVGKKISSQLEEQTFLFLSDRSRNYLDKSSLKISPIFKWYKKDFEKGWNSLFSLEEFLAYYSKPLGLTKKETQALLDHKIDIEFLDYDWQLNKK